MEPTSGSRVGENVPTQTIFGNYDALVLRIGFVAITALTYFVAGLAVATVTAVALGVVSWIFDSIFDTRIVSTFLGTVGSARGTHRVEEREMEVQGTHVQPQLQQVSEQRRFDVSRVALPQMGPVKRELYDCLTNNARVSPTALSYAKYQLPEDHPLDPVFLPGSLTRTRLEIQAQGSFYYPSLQGTRVWTPDFAGEEYGGRCFDDPCFTQEEHQMAEHPALLHLCQYLQSTNTVRLEGNTALLIEDVPRYGIIDITKRVPRLEGTLYGRNLVQASPEERRSKIVRLQDRPPSNIFAIAAPRIQQEQFGQPYRIDQLRTIAGKLYTAFRAIRDRAEAANEGASVDFGNWGCGVFGNNPKVIAMIAIAMANLVGIDELYYYTMGEDFSGDWHQKLVDFLKPTSISPRDAAEEYAGGDEWTDVASAVEQNKKVIDLLHYIIEDPHHLGLLCGPSNRQ